jgi:Arc/MetJ-type ribon-helix-helix transcriptional regulator
MATIHLSIPKQMLSEVDAEAKRECRSRSELMRAALKIYLERRERWDDIFGFGQKLARRKGLTPKDVEGAIREVRGR